MRLFIGRRPADLQILTSLTIYDLSSFEDNFDNSESNFHLHVNSILDAIGIGRIRKNLCNYDHNFLCSIHEIALNQWLFSEFTLFPPRLLEDNFNHHESWIDSFGIDSTKYLKAEINFFISIQPDFDYHNITVKNCFNDFKAHRLYEPLYLMTFLKGDRSESPFDDDQYISYLGVIYKNRFFPELIKEIAIYDLLVQSESEYLIQLQRRKLRDDGNPLVRTTHRLIPYPELTDNHVSWTLLSGKIDEDNTRRVYQYNSTDTYVLTNLTFWHSETNSRGDRQEEITIQPWRNEVYLAFGSDQIQYEPNIGQKTDIAYYSPIFKAHVDLEYSKISSVFDTKTYKYTHEGRFYQLSKEGQEEKNRYHNYVFEDAFNSSVITGQSMFVTAPLYSGFGENMKENACELFNKANEPITFQNDYDSSINIEFYSGFALDAKQAYQINYVFDTYSLDLDSFTFFVPSHIYTSRLIIGEEFASTYFSEIRSMEKTRKLILII